jgi:hypothetical protein
MKQLQVPITEELMFSAKTKAFQEGIHLKTLVALALEQYINTNTNISNISNTTINANTTNTITPNTTNTNITITPNTSNSPITPENDEYYLLRKTEKVGRTLPGASTRSLGTYKWVVFDGCKEHFDINGDPIPIRYTDENGKTWEPDEEELQELSKWLGKPVKIER